MGKNSSQYLFLTGKVRALEKKLFDASKFNRLTEKEKTKSFLNDLADSGHHDFLIHEDFDKGLRNYIYFHYDYFRKNMADSTVLDIFMIKRDILNYINHIKNLKKIEFYEPAVFKHDWCKEKILPSFFLKVEEKLRKMLGPKEISRAGEAIIEYACIEIVQEEFISKLTEGRILDFWKYTIDIKNLLKKINSPQTGYYLKGGNIKQSFWIETKIGEDMPPKVEIQPYIKLIAEEENRMNWEYIIRRWIGSFIKEMRKITFGAEPVVSYLLSIIEESINLRTIYTGIQMGLSPLEIKEKLNLAYV
jgi:hypothetical protein